MKNKIVVGSQEVEYLVKVSTRARRLRLAVYSDGRVVATLPRRMRQNVLEEFIAKKAQWIIEKVEYVKKFPGRALKGSQSDFVQYRERALALARERVQHFAGIYGLTYHKITIKNSRTRWGSCSKKGNLNFNYKIALLPPPLVDYLVVHELCHLKEFNHSKNFWSLVSQTIPDYRTTRAELRKQGLRNT